MSKKRKSKQRKTAAQRAGKSENGSDGQAEIPFADSGDAVPAGPGGKPASASAAAGAAAYQAARDAAAVGPGQDGGNDAGAGLDKDAGLMVPAALLREAEARRDEYLLLAQKTKAELENYRKRVQRDMANLKRESLADFLKKFFCAFDDLDRALAEGEKKHDYKVFHHGVKLVRDNLWKVLEGQGVKVIAAMGREFDPNLHEAMTSVPSPDHAPNTVINVFQPGYMLDDFVLQPARVIVSAAVDESGSGTDGADNTDDADAGVDET